jgi:hypothetical protein
MSARYSEEPRCERCKDPLVVHRGKDHAGSCCGIGCLCPAFVSREVENTWSP